MIKLCLYISDVIHANEQTKYANCGLHVNFWNFLLMSFCSVMKKDHFSKNCYVGLRSPLVSIGSITLFFFSNFLEIPENSWTATSQSYKKARWNGKYKMKKIIRFMILISSYESNLDALSETVRKIHDLKKASAGKMHRAILSYCLKHQYNGLFYLIPLM